MSTGLWLHSPAPPERVLRLQEVQRPNSQRRRNGGFWAGETMTQLAQAVFPAKHGKRYHVSVTVFKFWPHWLPVPARIKHKPSVSCLSQLLPGLFLIPCHGFSRPGNGGGVHPGFRVASVGVLQTYGLIRTSHSLSESFVHWPGKFLGLTVRRRPNPPPSSLPSLNSDIRRCHWLAALILAST